MPRQTALAAADVIELHPMYLLRWEESEQAHVLLYPEGIVKLNGSAAEILKRCVGGRAVGDILAELKAEFGDADIEDDVYQFLEVSNDKGWTRLKA